MDTRSHFPVFKPETVWFYQLHFLFKEKDFECVERTRCVSAPCNYQPIAVRPGRRRKRLRHRLSRNWVTWLQLEVVRVKMDSGILRRTVVSAVEFERPLYYCITNDPCA